MLRNIQQYIYLSLLLVCISSPGIVCFVIAQEKVAPPARPTVDYSPIIAKLKEQLPRQMPRVKAQGLAIALVDGATLVCPAGIGYTDRNNWTKVPAHKLFRVQSICNTDTAIRFLIAV